MPSVPRPTPRKRRQPPSYATPLRPVGDVNRFRLLALLTAITVTALVWAASTDRSTAEPNPNTSAPPKNSTPIARTQPALPPPSTAPGSTTPPFMPLTADLGEGNAGDSVRRLQDRLRALQFDPGPSDGAFGPSTKRAVWAFEKLVIATPPGEVTGVVTPALWETMNQPLTVQARRPSATDTHLEIYLPQQVAVLFVAGSIRLITHISSGSGENWCDEVTIDNDDGGQTTKGICGTSITPGGVYHFRTKAQGWKNAALGHLYNPVYFNYGIAVHGAGNVPDRPASHGCVRIPLHIAEYFPTLVHLGDAVYVFDGVKEPEAYGAQLPVFDYPDPNYTTTSSTTVVPTTTQPSVTTTAPQTTTVPTAPPTASTSTPPTTIP